MPYIVTSETDFPGEATPDYDMDVPEGHEAGDLLIAIATNRGGATVIAASAGWTQIGPQSREFGQRTACFRKVAANSNEPPLELTGTNNGWIVTIVAIRGANQSAPINAVLRSDNPQNGVMVAEEVTTTEDNCLVLYAWGTGTNRKLIPENPASIVMIGRDTDGTNCVQLVGYKNQITAGDTGDETALAESGNIGGQSFVIAIEDATPSTPQRAPFATETYEILARYGGISTAAASAVAFIRHDNVTWESASELAASSIDGMDVINVPTFAEQAFQPVERPWGSMTGLSYGGSAIDNNGRWMGVTHEFPSTDMSGKIFSVEFMINGVSPARFGSEGVVLVLEDSDENWAAFRLSQRSGIRNAVAYTAQVDVENTPPLDSDGTVDWSDIVRVGYLLHKRTTNTTAVVLRIKNALLLGRTVLVDGCEGSPCSPALVMRIMEGWGPVGIGSLQGGGQGLWRAGVRYGDGVRQTYVETAATSYELPLRATPAISRRFWQIPDNVESANFMIRASATDTIDMSACIMVTDTLQNFIIASDSSPAAFYNFDSTSLVGWRVTHNTAGVVINGATFKECGQITLNGGSLRRCLVIDSFASSAVVTNDPSNIERVEFTSAGSGHALEITEAGTYSFVGNLFHGYAGVDGSTGNEAVFVNVSSGTVTLNISGGGDTPSVRTAGATVVINNTVQFTFTVLDSAGTPQTGYEWRLYIKDPTPGIIGLVELAGEEHATLSTQVYEYNYIEDTDVKLQIIEHGFVEYLEKFTLGVTPQAVNVRLITEENL